VAVEEVHRGAVKGALAMFAGFAALDCPFFVEERQFSRE
jgi:hypothetical protein